MNILGAYPFVDKGISNLSKLKNVMIERYSSSWSINYPNNNMTGLVFSEAWDAVAQMLRKKYPTHIFSYEGTVFRSIFRYHIDPGSYFYHFKENTIAIISISSKIDKVINDGRTVIDGYNITIKTIGQKHGYYINQILRVIDKRYHSFIDSDTHISLVMARGMYDTTGYAIYKYPMEKIIFKGKDLIVDRIDNFVKSGNLYTELHIPYRLGILLYGNPGTGKTSFVYALASKYNMDIFMVKKVSDISSDVIINNGPCNNTTKIVRGIVLIEEIDTLFEKNIQLAISETDSRENISNGNLRDFLTGIDMLDEYIIVATTNHIERLDPAVIRDGRFDIKVELHNMDRELAAQMIEYYHEDPEKVLKELEGKMNLDDINPAALESYLKDKITRRIGGLEDE